MRSKVEKVFPQHIVVVDSVDFEGKGVARLADGKAVFIEGAMTGEKVRIEIRREKSSFATAKTLEVLEPSIYRVEPKCRHFGMCGGCSTQHIAFAEQVRIKQQVLIDNLKHLGGVVANEILPPLMGVEYGYRHRARFSARFVIKKERALVGFREKGSPYVADMDSCEVLPRHVSDLIVPLRDMIGQMDMKLSVPQIEVAVGEKVTVLVIRNMIEVNQHDLAMLREFALSYQGELPIQIWLQPKGPDTCYPVFQSHLGEDKVAITSEFVGLNYYLKYFDIDMPYYPAEFTQVNPFINDEMVKLAIDLLQPQTNEVIADFFCGIGNFTLPIAKFAKQVVGIEGSEPLVKRAKQNAEHNNLANKVAYQVCNLFKIDGAWLNELGSFDKWLIDPPRDGAFELVKALVSDLAKEAVKPKLIVYVSCNPATLARDAGVLVAGGYKLTKAGVMNMFPHTSHVESIAVFEKV